MSIYDGMKTKEHSDNIKRTLKRMKSDGIRLGSPIKALPHDIDMVIKQRRSGLAIAYIAKNIGLSVGLIHKLTKIFKEQIEGKPYNLRELTY